MKPGGNRVQMGDLGQPNILVPLGMIEGRTEIRRSIAESASLMLLFLSLNKVTQSSKQILAVRKQCNTDVYCKVHSSPKLCYLLSCCFCNHAILNWVQKKLF